MEPLSTWLEHNLRLPSGLAAEGGPIRLWPTQKGIADALGDPEIERVTLVKSARSGFTTLLSGLVAHHCVNDPCPVLVVNGEAAKMGSMSRHPRGRVTVARS